MSPLSDTSNLHSAIVKVNLFDHIKAMVVTTLPSFVISLILVIIVGFKFAPKDGASLDTIKMILTTLDTTFVISPLLTLPILMVLGMIIFKIPAIPGILFMSVVGSFCAIFIQGASLAEAVSALHYGFVSDTGQAMVDSLLTRGGMDSMMGTVSIIFCAIAFGGLLEVSGMIKLFVDALLKYIKTSGSLIMSTVVACFVLNIITIDNYVAAVVAGSMFRDAYTEKGLSHLNLSRCLAESAAITSPLIPWNTCGLVMISMLGVHPFAYAPYAFLCWVPPLVTIIFGYLNIGVIREDKDKGLGEFLPNINMTGIEA